MCSSVDVFPCRSSAQQEQQAVLDRLQQSQRELEQCRAELERLKSEASSHGELSRSNLGALHSELARLRTQIEDKE